MKNKICKRCLLELSIDEFDTYTNHGRACFKRVCRKCFTSWSDDVLNNPDIIAQIVKNGIPEDKIKTIRRRKDFTWYWIVWWPPDEYTYLGGKKKIKRLIKFLKTTEIAKQNSKIIKGYFNRATIIDLWIMHFYSTCEILWKSFNTANKLQNFLHKKL